jgi:HK97 family phage major capsid protein
MSDELIKRLSERRLNAWEAAKEILGNAEAEGRTELSGEEEQAWQRANADLDALDARIKSMVDAEQRAVDAEAAFASVAPTAAAPQREGRDIVRAFASGEARSLEVSAEQLGAAVESRDLTKGSATAGGNTVPTSFAGMLWEHLIETAAIASVATVFNTAGGDTFEVPITTTHATGALITEGSTLTESDAAFAKRSLGAYKYAYSFQVSSELLSDTGVDLTGYFARQAGTALGNALGADLATGNASSKPSGVVQTSTLGVTGDASVSGKPTAANLIDLYYSVISPYRNSSSCVWLMRDATAAHIRKIRDDSGASAGTGNYLWVPGFAAAPDTILGKPVLIEPNLAAMATSAKSIVFGDMSRYLVRIAGGVRFERSDEFAFQNDLVTFRAILRGDGVLGDQTGAVKHYIGNAA